MCVRVCVCVCVCVCLCVRTAQSCCPVIPQINGDMVVHPSSHDACTMLHVWGIWVFVRSG